MGKLTSATWAKIALIILLFLGICGAFRIMAYMISQSAGVASNIFWSVYESRSFDGPYQTESGSVLGNSVTELDINWAAGKVNVHTVKDSPSITSSDQFIELSITGRDGAPVRWYTTDAASGGQALVVDYGFDIGLFGCTLAHSGKEIDIAIPESIAKGLHLITLNAASGDYILEGLECDAADINLASGSLNASRFKPDVFELDMASGICDLGMDVTTHAEIQIASGSCRWRCLSAAPESVNASLMSGNLNILLPEETGFDLSLDKASGNLNVPPETMQRDGFYQLRYESAGDEPIVNMDIDMASGDLSINPQ